MMMVMMMKSICTVCWVRSRAQAHTIACKFSWCSTLCGKCAIRPYTVYGYATLSATLCSYFIISPACRSSKLPTMMQQEFSSRLAEVVLVRYVSHHPPSLPSSHLSLCMRRGTNQIELNWVCGGGLTDSTESTESTDVSVYATSGWIHPASWWRSQVPLWAAPGTRPDWGTIGWNVCVSFFCWYEFCSLFLSGLSGVVIWAWANNSTEWDLLHISPLKILYFDCKVQRNTCRVKNRAGFVCCWGLRI